mmetsp:Transcript_14780/g.26588  ORF Transcript_14780/g.26588 Transcript_14780/m.26588 type:complete len:96 (+) Transcript_14780:477-764(+)
MKGRCRGINYPCSMTEQGTDKMHESCDIHATTTPLNCMHGAPQHTNYRPAEPFLCFSPHVFVPPTFISTTTPFVSLEKFNKPTNISYLLKDNILI